jgi:membrane-associated phospholipid phosphatase
MEWSRVERAVWIAFFILVIVLSLAAVRFPYFPGDVTFARLLQSVAPGSKKWAESVTSTAKTPWSLVLLAASVLFSWAVARWRAALLAVASFLLAWGLGIWLNPLVARPRPTPELIRVVGSPSGYSFPSAFALTYAATLGFLAVLAALKCRGGPRWAALVTCSALLAIGGWARVALGAHWPSDILISYLMGILWSVLLLRFVK